MNVGELIELLKQFNPNTPVVLAGDEEGNDFHWLTAYSSSFVKQGAVHLYAVYDEDDIKEEREAAEEEWGDEVPEFDPVLVLWP